MFRFSMNNKLAPVPLLVKFNPLRFSHLFLLVAYISLTIGNKAAQGQASILRKIELGFSTGPLFFLGDLGGNMGAGTQFFKDIDWQETRLGIGGQLNFYPVNWISLRAGYFHGTLSANDRHSPNLTPNDIFRFNRNLHFRSRLDEFYAGVEVYPFRMIPTKRVTIFDQIQPYGFMGVGLFRFNPKAQDTDGTWVALHPLRLEGQDFAEYPGSKGYQLVQRNLLSGIGIRYYVNESIYIGTEIVYRKLFTDQIDNVSANFYVDPTLFDTYLNPADAARAKRLYYQGLYDLGGQLPHQVGIQRGNPANNDAYFGQNIQIGFKIYPRKDNRFNCPVTY